MSPELFCLQKQEGEVLTLKDKRKIELLQMTMARKLSIQESALAFGCSKRHVYRLLRRLEEKGLDGMVHGNRGKPSHRRTKDEVKAKILQLVQGKYRDVNDTHLTELLLKNEKIRIGRETLRSILRQAGIKAKRQRRSPKYRSRRERKEAMGMMLQIDGSPHDWLEGRGQWLTLIGAKDDATGYVWAHFAEAETTWAYMNLMEDVFASHGLPLTLYSDRHTIFHTSREQTIVEQLKDIRPLSQFGHAMNDLGISIIKAWSPQAKGRVERQWGVFQDRLVVEMRLAGISSMEEANAFLSSGFLADYNKRFTVPAKSRTSVFRSVPAKSKLERILCIRQKRVVAKDHTISFEGLILQIPPTKRFHSLASRTVDVLQLKDGRIEILYQNHVVSTFSQAAVTRMVNQYEPSKTELKLVVSN